MTYTLNILDLLFTLYALSHGAYELNPFMQSIPFMIFYKVIVLGILCWFLESMKQNRVARVGRKICLFAFLAVDAWHIFNLMGGMIYG